jgi:hypothetical protein
MILYALFNRPGKGQHVFKISVVRARQFYGFDPMVKIFFKVFVYDSSIGMQKKKQKEKERKKNHTRFSVLNA